MCDGVYDKYKYHEYHESSAGSWQGSWKQRGSARGGTRSWRTGSWQGSWKQQGSAQRGTRSWQGSWIPNRIGAGLDWKQQGSARRGTRSWQGSWKQRGSARRRLRRTTTAALAGVLADETGAGSTRRGDSYIIIILVLHVYIEIITS